MSGLDYCLEVVGILSGTIHAAEQADDVDLLAGIICACQMAEYRAQQTAAGRIPANIVNDIKAEASVILGPGWQPSAK